MRNYWPEYRKRVLIAIASIQSIFIIILFGILQLIKIINLDWLRFFATTFICAVVLNAITITLVHLFSRPFQRRVQAVELVSNEPGANTPPNADRYRYDKDGFREILQTVYERSTPKNTQQDTKTKVDSTLTLGLNNSQTGIVIMDANHQIIYHNSSAPVSTDTDNKLLVNIIFPEDDSLTSWLDNVSKNTLKSEHTWIRVSDKLPGEPNRRMFDVAASFHKNNSAETVLTFFDKSRTYLPEEDELDFISFAAHELRGPITVIRGYLDVLNDELQPALKQDQAELIQRLIVTSNRLDNYVNNILNASQYDRRHLKLHLSEESVRHIYDQISDDMQLRAKTQNRVLIVDIPNALPTIVADANAVGEVIANLIDNAIKYSNEGGMVHVTARAISGFVEISVIDRGIGMPQNVLPNLFHKFYRSHRSRETVAGTGIGLYICRAIVSSHGGDINVRSVENEGSTFSFTLPIYDTVAEKLKSVNHSNVALIEHGRGWIRNHSMIKG